MVQNSRETMHRSGVPSKKKPPRLAGRLQGSEYVRGASYFTILNFTFFVPVK